MTAADGWDARFAEFARRRALDDARVLGPDGIRPECRLAVPCVFCGADDRAPFHDAPPFRFGRCRRCGLVYLDPRLDRAACLRRPTDPSMQYYADQLSPLQADARSAQFRWAVARLKRLLPAGRVLEVGAANGYLQRELRAAGYATVGVEPNPASCRRAQADLGIGLVNAPFDDYDPPAGAFDGVVFFESLYHTFDPVAAVAKAYAALRPGGLLLVSTIQVGSLNWKWFPASRQWANGLDIPFLFDFASLRDLLERGGFTLRRIDSYGDAVSLGAVLRLLARGGRPPAAGGEAVAAPADPARRSLAGALLGPLDALWRAAVRFAYLDRYLLVIAQKV